MDMGRAAGMVPVVWEVRDREDMVLEAESGGQDLSLNIPVRFLDV